MTKGETMAERVGRLEEWTEGHENRCEERLLGIGREIRDLKDGVKGDQKWTRALIVAICAWALSQVYDNIAHPHAMTTTVQTTTALHTP